MGEYLPDSFAQITLRHLRTIRPRTEVPFEDFADRLITATGLTWTAPDMTHSRLTLHTAIRRMVIDILDDFGGVRCTYRPNRLIDTIKDLHTFEIMPLGTALLDSLVIQVS
jgi:hypothetical protein